jgi:alkylation response protein AidB-like acyl-CoA dehydrogenase
MTTTQHTSITPETPSREQLVQRALDLGPVLSSHSAKGEADRRLPQGVIDALKESGLFKLTVPKRYGGYETDLRTVLETVAAIGEGDGGAAWVAAILNGVGWMTGLFSAQAQDEVFGADPEARVCGVLTPSAKTERLKGGYRVSGKWYFASGSAHASWAVVSIPLVDNSGITVDGGMALIPATDYRIEDTWFVAGMRSTGSNCLIVDDVFVPDHRVLSLSRSIEGEYATEYGNEALYRSAFVPFLTLNMVGPQLGMGRAALRFVMDKAGAKGIAYTNFAKQADSTVFHLRIAEAAMKLDTAMLHAYRGADDVDRAAKEGVYPDYTTRARARADTGRSVAFVVDAINGLLTAHGAASFADSSPLQRIWRDSSTAARHAHVLPDIGYEVYGKALLGIDEAITVLV